MRKHQKQELWEANALKKDLFLKFIATSERQRQIMFLPVFMYSCITRVSLMFVIHKLILSVVLNDHGSTMRLSVTLICAHFYAKDESGVNPKAHGKSC